jgi:hypothetical protein
MARTPKVERNHRVSWAIVQVAENIGDGEGARDCANEGRTDADAGDLGDAARRLAFVHAMGDSTVDLPSICDWKQSLRRRDTRERFGGIELRWKGMEEDIEVRNMAGPQPDVDHLLKTIASEEATGRGVVKTGKGEERFVSRRAH